MTQSIKVAFASGTDDLNQQLVARMRDLFPDLPLYLVSEFPPEPAVTDVTWVPYHSRRGFFENLSRCRAAFQGKRVRLAGVMLVPNVPYRRMRLIALVISPLGFLAFNENLNNFMLRPRSLPTIARHFLWRARNLARWAAAPGGPLAIRLWRLRHPAEWRVGLSHALGLTAGLLVSIGRTARAETRGPDRSEASPAPSSAPTGISVVIPSRNGRELLAAQFPGLVRELEPFAGEIVVVDNGSDSGDAGLLRSAWPQVLVVESAEPLSFAKAVNLGIAASRYSHVCLLNNDMLLDAGFFDALVRAFAQVPELFCATAQIRFPPGARREETGKTVMRQPQPEDFPVRCDEPFPGEDLSYVLYGSGGCSLYDAAKLRELGGVDEAYAPAYVEDLDLGYRAWRHGWPSVFVAGAEVEHRHRSTTSRYYSAEQLEEILETNYLRFLSRSVASPRLFRDLWRRALRRLLLMARPPCAEARRLTPDSAALRSMAQAARIALSPGTAFTGHASEELFLALTNGSTAVFPGRRPGGKPRILVASPYLPFPLAHGGAVRMYNLMLRAAEEFDQVLVAFTDRIETPPAELLEICVEVVLVAREGSHSLPASPRPEVVEEFSSPAFRAALQQTARKWRPSVAQLEFTQMAQYAGDCAPARPVLVEHDITFDLYEQLVALEDGWETRRQLQRWRTFETQAWREVACVVTMSEKDAARIQGARAAVLPNGVDLNRFQPSPCEPELGRILFIGSFAHLPNLLAVDFFVREVLPLVPGATLHVIAGARHEYFLRHYRERVQIDLLRPGIEVEGFVADVRPAYRRACVVVAPLLASAGTNVKVMEAMAMGKVVVATPAGVNGLDLVPGRETVIAAAPSDMAAEITRLLTDAAARKTLEQAARARVERDFGWDAIARRQARLYRDLL